MFYINFNIQYINSLAIVFDQPVSEVYCNIFLLQRHAVLFLCGVHNKCGLSSNNLL